MFHICCHHGCRGDHITMRHGIEDSTCIIQASTLAIHCEECIVEDHIIVDIVNAGFDQFMNVFAFGQVLHLPTCSKSNGEGDIVHPIDAVILCLLLQQSVEQLQGFFAV